MFHQQYFHATTNGGYSTFVQQLTELSRKQEYHCNKTNNADHTIARANYNTFGRSRGRKHHGRQLYADGTSSTKIQSVTTFQVSQQNWGKWLMQKCNGKDLEEAQKAEFKREKYRYYFNKMGIMGHTSYSANLAAKQYVEHLWKCCLCDPLTLSWNELPS